MADNDNQIKIKIEADLHPAEDVHEKGDRRSHPRRSRTGAGVLPVALYNNELHILVQHEITESKPDSMKNYGFTDFGGAMKPEDNENIHLVAAREFMEEVYNGLDLLLPADLAGSAEVLAEHLKSTRLLFVQSYAMFILPVHYVPACILAEGLAKDDYRSGKKIQTLWWFSLSEMKRVYLPLHQRVLSGKIILFLSGVERKLKGNVSDKPRRPWMSRHRRRGESSSGDKGGEAGAAAVEKAPEKSEAELEAERRTAEEEGLKWAADMRAKSATYLAGNEEVARVWRQRLAGDPGRYKLISRRCMWETMDMLKQVTKPSPCLERIPNFVCADLACQKLADSPEFRRRETAVVKVNPSLAQTKLRQLVLSKNKILLTPSPALEDEYFIYLLDPKEIRQRDRAFASTKKGAEKLGEGLTATCDWTGLHIDLLVMGSVLVCPKTGARVGKGTGWAELEVAIFTELGLIDDNTIFATTVHDGQIVFAYPGSELSVSHDIRVDMIATPTRLIRITSPKSPKKEGDHQEGEGEQAPSPPRRQPAKIQWDLIDEAKLAACPILRQMKDRATNGVPRTV